jgi:hypothetical protein
VPKPPSKVPKPSDLGKPILSSEDLQSLIDDLSSAESEIMTPPLAKKVARAPSPVKVVKPQPKPEVKPKIRVPSSWIPSKMNSPNNVKKESFPFVPKYKIPKEVQQVKSPVNSPGEASSKLTTFNLFQLSKKVLKPEVKTEEKQQIDKIKIVKSSSVEKKHRQMQKVKLKSRRLAQSHQRNFWRKWSGVHRRRMKKKL